ncbi:MAG: fumarylacetoacetate hydrolase family protein [Bacteroidota bacterium]
MIERRVMKRGSFFCLFLLLGTLTGCQEAATDAADASANTSELMQDADAPFEVLGPAIAGELIQARSQVRTTTILSMLPDMGRDAAYEVQLEALRIQEAAGEQRIGWKMGGTRVTEAGASPDPSFAYILRSDSLDDGAQLSAATYVDGDVLVEAEIAFIMGKDLAGSSHSAEAVRDAVAAVAGAIELIDIRVVAGEDGEAPGMNHMIAANLSHAGIILTEARLPLETVDLAAETAVVYVDGEEAASGSGNQIMGTTPMDALVWIANALPGQGLMLRAGDVVITGGLYDNPVLATGNSAEVTFSSFGRIGVSMGD